MNWTEFLSDNHIHYVTAGPNTKRGEVSIKCPWCGADDPSEHLGINLTSDHWGCLRNYKHRGKSISYLIRGLLGCSKAQAKFIAEQYDKADPENLEQALEALDEKTEPTPEQLAGPLVLPPEFRLLTENGSGLRFYNYVRNRGFNRPDKVAHIYGIRYCTTGRWKDRIILPVKQRGKLVAWTGRSIAKSATAPRYLSTGNAIKTAIFNEDEIYLGGKILFVTEGPFDAIKIDYFGYKYGGHATCVFGTSITIDQISILKQVSKKYKKVVLLLDPDAIETSFDVLEWLPNLIMGNLPEGVEDPGALSASQVVDLVKSML